MGPLSPIPPPNPTSRLSAALGAAHGATALIPFLTAGYPSLETSLELMRTFAAAGARAIEVGIPFSDPIADGPDIQRASERAIAAGTGVAEVLALVARFRSEAGTPVVLMTYCNPVLRYGAERFADEARRAGVDGVLLSDLPANELPEAWAAFDRAGLDTVMLVAPTTTEERLPEVCARARGFVYCLARTGVTGAGAGERGALPERVAAIRRHTALPVAVGFGIATAADAAALRGVADAVVVGAAFVREIAAGAEPGAATRVRALTDALVGALRSS